MSAHISQWDEADVLLRVGKIIWIMLLYKIVFKSNDFR